MHRVGVSAPDIAGADESNLPAPESFRSTVAYFESASGLFRPVPRMSTTVRSRDISCDDRPQSWRCRQRPGRASCERLLDPLHRGVFGVRRGPRGFLKLQRDRAFYAIAPIPATPISSITHN
jgi:hypothetical protein